MAPCGAELGNLPRPPPGRIAPGTWKNSTCVSSFNAQQGAGKKSLTRAGRSSLTTDGTDRGSRNSRSRMMLLEGLEWLVP